MSEHPAPLQLIYSTWPDSLSAEQAARQLLEEKLIACCNIMAPGRSVYLWEGEVQCDSEHVAIFKTVQSQSERVCQRLIALHPYDEPAIIALNTDQSGTSRTFQAWVSDCITAP